MVIKCVVCNVQFKANSEIKFHSFPKDECRKCQWKSACGLNLCLPSYRVCSSHFRSEDYELSGLLKKNAVPCKENTLINSTMTTPKKNKPDGYLTITQSSVYESCVTPRKHDLDGIKYLSIPQLSSSVKRHKHINPDTIGLLSPSHFSTPKCTKRNIQMIKNKYKQKQIQNYNLKKQIQRLSVKLKICDELIEKLQHKNLLSENASNHHPVILLF